MEDVMSFLRAVAAVCVVVFGVDAEARPARSGAQPQRQAAAVSPLKAPAHLRQVAARTKKYTRWVFDGEPGKGDEIFFHAAFAELLPVKGIAQKQTKALSYGANNSHANDRSQRLQVSGIGADGIWRGHLVGTVSVHDLLPASEEPTLGEWKGMEQATKQRIASDFVRVSYDYGPGTQATVIADRVKSQAATAIPIEVPLNKNGITRVIYDRTTASGHVVGASDAYVGRIVEIEWSGK
jgi:hypothetical protein